MRPIQKLSDLYPVAGRRATACLHRGRAHPLQRAISSGATASEQGLPLKPSGKTAAAQGISVDELLSKSSWSVRSLLPGDAAAAAAGSAISSSQLHHLLRLSALSPPKTAGEEAAMLRTLEAQLHFVREVQRVDTAAVQPLRALRDETDEGIADMTVGLSDLRHALAQEEATGRMRRPKRRTGQPVDTMGAEDWDALACAERRVGRYFVVDISEGEKGRGVSES